MRFVRLPKHVPTITKDRGVLLVRGWIYHAMRSSLSTHPSHRKWSRLIYLGLSCFFHSVFPRAFFKGRSQSLMFETNGRGDASSCASVTRVRIQIHQLMGPMSVQPSSPHLQLSLHLMGAPWIPKHIGYKEQEKEKMIWSLLPREWDLVTMGYLSHPLKPQCQTYSVIIYRIKWDDTDLGSRSMKYMGKSV